MVSQLAFVSPLSATTFTGRTLSPALTTIPPCRPASISTRRTLRMADEPAEKKPLFSNPFAKKPAAQDAAPASTSAEPQPGDPGSKPSIAQAVASKLPVVSGATSTVKRGLDLLREDLLKNAPERAGVGRQDSDSVVMKPVAGEPGYKPQSYETIKVSELGISPFVDDENAVGKVGGIEAVKKAAIEVKAGKSSKQIKSDLLNANVVDSKGFDIPDYLKPIPEDTPRKGMTWKNYEGR